MTNGTQNYVGEQTISGFTTYATQVDITTPCIGGKLGEADYCIDVLPAVMGYNITGDNWLIYQ